MCGGSGCGSDNPVPSAVLSPDRAPCRARFSKASAVSAIRPQGCNAERRVTFRTVRPAECRSTALDRQRSLSATIAAHFGRRIRHDDHETPPRRNGRRDPRRAPWREPGWQIRAVHRHRRHDRRYRLTRLKRSISVMQIDRGRPLWSRDRSAASGGFPDSACCGAPVRSSVTAIDRCCTWRAGDRCNACADLR